MANGAYDDGKCVIYGGDIPELKGFSISKEDIIVGGACTVTELANHLRSALSNLTGNIP